MPQVVLNPRNVAKLDLPQPPRDRVLYWDAAPSSPPMFGVRVTADGNRSYIVGFRTAGRSRLLTLDSVEAITLADARSAARKALGTAAAGEDPLAAKRANRANSIAALAEDFLASKEVQRLKTKASYGSTIRKRRRQDLRHHGAVEAHAHRDPRVGRRYPQARALHGERGPRHAAPDASVGRRARTTPDAPAVPAAAARWQREDPAARVATGARMQQRH